MNYQIISLTNDFLPEIMIINQQTAASSWSVTQFLDEFKIEDSIKLGIVNRKKKNLVAFAFARLITIRNPLFKDLSFLNKRPARPSEIEIFLIATQPRYQKQGLGKLLLGKILDLAGNSTEVFLEVRKSNEKARSFYLNNGFKTIGERPNYYRDPSEPAVLMKFISER